MQFNASEPRRRGFTRCLLLELALPKPSALQEAAHCADCDRTSFFSFCGS